ncbi:hypothetical protein [Streptomyces chilikensis]|uniref:Uncharacterized protein n=1 Tax=Streptomyces chilikensis TaxID=1194079 RepID=A0ABV3EN68_9ACTN
MREPRAGEASSDGHRVAERRDGERGALVLAPAGDMPEVPGASRPAHA